MSEVLDRGYLGMGKDVQVFEKNLSSFFGRNALCVVNGTAALHLSLQALGISRGDEVLVPSLTYISTFQAISACGAKPVACEIYENTLTIDLENAQKQITKKTKAILPVHYAGGVADLDKVYLFAKKNKLRVIEDAAHAFGTKYKNKRVGNIGDIVCFSFDGIKNITSGEGGCIVTSDKKVIDKIKDSRLLGVIKDTEKRYSGLRSWNFDVKEQGWRYHMSNLMAAIGIVQLEKFNKLSKKRQELAKYYDKLLEKISFVKILKQNYDEVVPHIYTIRLLDNSDRDKLREKLNKKGIETGIHYYPNHKLSFYKLKKKEILPLTDKIFNQLLTLPLHPDLRKKDIRYIVSEIKKIKIKKNVQTTSK